MSTGKIFMTRGWGEVARVCHAKGALATHFEYDGASTLFFKVFDMEGCRLECCPGGAPSRCAPRSRFLQQQRPSGVQWFS